MMNLGSVSHSFGYSNFLKDCERISRRTEPLAAEPSINNDRGVDREVELSDELLSS